MPAIRPWLTYSLLFLAIALAIALPAVLWTQRSMRSSHLKEMAKVRAELLALDAARSQDQVDYISEVQRLLAEHAQTKDQLAAAGRLTASLETELGNWRQVFNTDEPLSEDLRLRTLHGGGRKFDDLREPERALANIGEREFVRAFNRQVNPLARTSTQHDNVFAIYSLGDDFLVAGRFDWRPVGAAGPHRTMHWIYSERVTDDVQVGGYRRRIRQVQMIPLPLDDHSPPELTHGELLWQTLMGFALSPQPN